jgi:hypothetical protein
MIESAAMPCDFVDPPPEEQNVVLIDAAMQLTKNEKQTLVLALGRALEHEARALENCISQTHPRNPHLPELDKAIQHRRRTLQELEQLRTRLTTRNSR